MQCGAPNDLHGRSVTDEVLQLASAVVEQPSFLKLVLVVLVEHILHRLPEALLPLEDRLLRDDVRSHSALETAREEVVRQVHDVVVGVVVHDSDVVVIDQLPSVDDLRFPLRLPLRIEAGDQLSPADGLPTSPVLAAHRVPLEEDRLLESELDAFDVNRVSGNGDAVPPAPHGAIGRAPRLLQAHGLLLHLRGRDGGLLKDGADAGPGVHGVLEHLVLGVVPRLAAQVIVLPILRQHKMQRCEVGPLSLHPKLQKAPFVSPTCPRRVLPTCPR
eukprot:scaffold101_cov230-Pinguiococcus_pyrenoidosus.AAC.6